MEDKFELELDRAVKEIKKNKAKKVCIQLPDGLKPLAGKIYDELKKKTDAELFIWSGSCFGACDIPFYLDEYGFDMIIQWGHAPWKKD
jgi:2-(3-amino-3-carboxypropyl)histidine synthase